MHTFGFFVLALQGPGVTGDLTPPAESTNLVHLIPQAPLPLAVLAILLVFSAVSWGIVTSKIWQFRTASRQTASFLDIFHKSNRFSEVVAVCNSLTASPLVGLFQAGYAELNAQLRAAGAGAETQPAAPAARPTLRSVDALDRALLRASTVELSRLERRVPFLATTASITPYIGLFGTVWGIISAFQGIAGSGSTSLSVVAPGIAEALIATAAGLFAAIPAVYFYNDLTGQVKRFAGLMEDFSMEFLNIAERNFS